MGRKRERQSVVWFEVLNLPHKGPRGIDRPSGRGWSSLKNKLESGGMGFTGIFKFSRTLVLQYLCEQVIATIN
jgi:hypothetical protein